MSTTSGGPNNVNNGLVLYIDAANIKSFKGEPTTNMVPSPYAYSLYAYVTGPTDATALNENYKEISVKRYTISNVVNTARAAIYPSGLTTSTFYTFSFKWKYNGTNVATPSISLTAAKGNPEGGSNNNTFTSEVVETKSIGNGWYFTYYTFAFSSVPTSACMLTFGIVTGTDNTYLNQTFDIYEAQFEQKAYVTPYVLGTRGTTVATGGGWADRTVNANHGEFVNGPTFNSANCGSIVFDGNDDYIIMNHVGSGNTFTHEVFLKPTNVSKDQMYIGYNNYTAHYVRIVNSAAFLSISSTTGQKTLGHTQTLLNNNVYHIVSIYDGVRMKIYVNNQLVEGTTINESLNGWGTSRIGRWLDADQRSFVGHIYLYKCYNRALSTQEILQNYNAQKSRFGLP